jgi:hypothetical protein
MFSVGWIGDAIKFLDFVNSPMGCKSVARMLIVLHWGEPVYRIRICVSVWKSGGEPPEDGILIPKHVAINRKT